ncbi:hypothetical protein VR46_32065, partial [Streptomyces sp. NRRL S-444]
MGTPLRSVAPGQKILERMKKSRPVPARNGTPKQTIPNAVRLPLTAALYFPARGLRQGLPVLLARAVAGQGAQPDHGARGPRREHLPGEVGTELTAVRQAGARGPGVLVGGRGHVGDQPART